MEERLSFEERLASESSTSFGWRGYIMPVLSCIGFVLAGVSGLRFFFALTVLPIANVLLAKIFDINTGKYVLPQLGLNILEAGFVAFTIVFGFYKLGGSVIGSFLAINTGLFAPVLISTAVLKKLSGSWKRTLLLLLAEPSVMWFIYYLALWITIRFG
jgi:hypothetical protein